MRPAKTVGASFCANKTVKFAVRKERKKKKKKKLKRRGNTMVPKEYIVCGVC